MMIGSICIRRESMQNDYENKKQNLILQIKQRRNAKQLIHLQKNTSNLFRNRRSHPHGIDVKQFNQVIQVDAENFKVNVEGMTTYETLVRECLKYNCLPTVVPELKTITVGGALAGCAIESSSFTYGLMHETVLEFEVLLSDGRVVLCTPNNEYQDLFFGFPNSYGTLGYALRVVLKLYPIKPYIKLIHQHFTNPKSYFESINTYCKKDNHQNHYQFVDGVVFGNNELYVTLGEMVDEVPYISDYTFMNIYYQSIRKKQEDYLKIHDYIWRWDTDWFWCSSYFYLQNPILRYLMGKKRLNSATYWQLRKFFTNNRIASYLYNLIFNKSESIIQDIQIPINQADNFLSFYDEKIGIYPLWICPTQIYQKGEPFDLYPMDENQLYINFGFWGTKTNSLKEEGFYNRLIEQKTIEFSGIKSLYSTVYYTENEFNHHYNQAIYKKLKEKYDPSHDLRSLYEKCMEK